MPNERGVCLGSKKLLFCWCILCGVGVSSDGMESVGVRSDGMESVGLRTGGMESVGLRTDTNGLGLGGGLGNLGESERVCGIIVGVAGGRCSSGWRETSILCVIEGKGAKQGKFS